MSFFKSIWGILFRLFPCPTEVGLRRVGKPTPCSPVVVTCNFHTTVKRLTAILKRSHIDAWLLVADSKGVNVWCAAGADDFSTHSVVSAVKTSGIGDLVNHRNLILPPLGAPGINLSEVSRQTGRYAMWGPVRAEDLPTYLNNGYHRDEKTKRATYDWRERLDTALGSLFPFYVLGAILVTLLARHLLPTYLFAAATAFLLFFLLCPRIPGERGIFKAILLIIFFTPALLLGPAGDPIRSSLIVAMITFLICGTELGGLASTMRSDLDPFLARLGVGAIGNVRLAGTVRTELLNGYRELTYDRDTCIGCGSCAEVCPIRVWEMDAEDRAIPAHRESCTACRACLTQCPSGAIQALAQEKDNRSATRGGKARNGTA
jgi:NAD-dependent dihydropyrimidine dehydrogenase PreA subunit